MTFVSEHATLPDVTLVYDRFDAPEAADAPLVVLVMGLGVQRIHWPDGFCEALARRGLRVVRFDLRDSGESCLHAPPPAPGALGLRAASRALLARLLDGDDARERFTRALPYTLDTLADDVVALLDHLGEDDAHLIGMSFGGAIAQRCAVRHPARVRSLVSVASTTGALDVSRPELRGLVTMLAPPPRTRAAAERAFTKALARVGSPGRSMPEPEARALAAECFARQPDPSGQGRMMLAMLAAGDRTAELARVRCPALVLHGDADPLVPLAAGEATARALRAGRADAREVRLRVLRGMGHDLPAAYWPELTAEIAALALAAAKAERAPTHVDGAVTP